MALRLRRGTDAERLLVTPLQGELVYATDTKKIYVGDGATLGGVIVGPTDADAFTSVVNDITPELGGELNLNGNDITGTGSINITGSIHATGNITADGDIGLGNDTSDVISVNGVINSSLRPALTDQYDLGTDARKWRRLLVNSVEANIDVQASIVYTDRIAGTDSSVLWDSVTDTLTVGNVNTDNITIAGTLDVATVNGTLYGNVVANDSTVVIDANTKTAAFNSATIEGGTLDGVVIGGNSQIPVKNISGSQIRAFGGFTGNLLGNVVGNVQGDIQGSIKGSVFGGDSSLIIDETTSTVVGDINNDRTTTSVVTASSINLSGTSVDAQPASLIIETDSNYLSGSTLIINGSNDSEFSPGLQFGRSRGTLAAPTALQSGDEISATLWIGTDSDGAYVPAAGLSAVVTDTPSTGLLPTSVFVATIDGSGNLVPSLEVAPNQVTKFYGPATLMSFADTTARDAAITAPVAGMMIYLTATNKAQVYDGSIWNDLY
tara:strand:- start:83 stop:1561 length:1479 start_codon:yes stop_codon:yes gene_type:complete